MKVEISPKAKKQLKKLTKLEQIVVAKKIRLLSKREGTKSIQKIKKHKNVYRVRVGDLRIVYKKYKKKIRIILIGHRRDIYKLVDRLLR